MYSHIFIYIPPHMCHVGGYLGKKKTPRRASAATCSPPDTIDRVLYTLAENWKHCDPDSFPFHGLAASFSKNKIDVL